MGVTGLWKLIEQSGKPVPLDTLEGKILAIDISIWLHQVTKGMQDGRGAAVQNAHLLGLFNRLCKLLYWRIKPVFIFDGGVPQLKRTTIEKRSMQRNRTNNEANRIEQVLLETLAQEKIVQQALGRKVEHLVSPSKNRPVKEKKPEDDMFKLPPLENELGVGYLPCSDEEEDSETEDQVASTELQHDIMDFFEKNIMKVDVNSALFKSLPPDKRHSILFEMKESRKQSSWGRLHEMPQEGEQFADFQMKRLLKRRLVQVSLEQAENEMGGRSLTFGELENLMAEDGILEPTKDNLKGQRIASDESTRFLLVKDIKKAIEDSKKTFEEQQKQKANESSGSNNESQEEIDLQMAIAMSLQDNNDPANLTQVDVLKTSDIRLSTPQRETLKHAAKASARDYMLEFGILNDDDIQDMFKKKKKAAVDEKLKENEPEIDFIATTKQSSDEEATEKKPDDEISISSSADTDFVDVPEDDFSGDVIAPNFPYPLPDSTPSKEFRIEDLTRNTSIKVCFDPTKVELDDLFADVFVVPDKESPVLLPKDTTTDQPREKLLETKRNLVETNENEFESPTKKVRLDDTLDVAESSISKSITDAKPKDLIDCSKTLEKASTNSDTQKIHESPEKLDQINEFISKEIKPAEKNITGNETKSPKIELTLNENLDQPTVVVSAEESKSPVLPIESPHKNKQFIDLTDDEPKPSTSSQTILETLAAKKVTSEEDEEILKKMEQELAQKHRQLEREINKMDRHAVSITEKMSVECQSLLRLFGIPYLVAPMEAEAQCAFLNANQFVDGIISDDSDVWLFGGNTVYKNFFDNNKIVLEFKAANIERLFKMDRKKLIQLAFLVGSDYTTGLHGVGPVTALEIIAAFTTSEDFTDDVAQVVSCLRKFRDWWMNGKNTYSSEVTVLKTKLKNIQLVEGFPNTEVARAYLYPEVDVNDEPFTWGEPDATGIFEFAKHKLGWTQSKTEDVFGPVLKRLNEKKSQATITNYFKVNTVERRQDLVVSKRVERAVRKLAGDEIEEEVPKKKQKKEKACVSPQEKTSKKVTRKKSSKKDLNTENNENETVDLTGSQEEPSSSSQDKAKKMKSTKRASKKSNSDAEELPKPEKVRKIPRIPDPNPPIMQRVKDQQLQEDAKKRASELFKKTQKQKKKTG